jgi:L-amino acid N-acyltransferase YncA
MVVRDVEESDLETELDIYQDVVPLRAQLSTLDMQ